MTDRKDISLHDDDVYEMVLEDIPDETISLVRTKSGTVSLNRRGIYNLAIRGMSVQDIAKCFGVSDNAIYTNFQVEVTSGRAMIGPRLKHNLIREAMREKPNPAILLFALKNFSELTEDGIKTDGPQNDVPVFNVIPPVFVKSTTLTDSERIELEGTEDNED